MAEPSIRRLRAFDRRKIAAHFQRLDGDSLRDRFGAQVSPEFVARYANSAFEPTNFMYGAFPDDGLRALAEMRLVPDSWPRACEAAFTVERDWQDRGIGDALFTRMLTVAQNRGIRELHMICLAENRRMQHLAQKHRAVLKLQPGQIEARLIAPWPTPLSLTREIAGEYRTYVRAIMNWPV